MTNPDNDAGRTESADSTSRGSEPSASGQEAPPIEQTPGFATDPNLGSSPQAPQPQDYTPPPAYDTPAYTPPTPGYEPPAYTPGFPTSGDFTSPPYPPPPAGYPPPYPEQGAQPPYPAPGYGPAGYGGAAYPPPGPYGTAPGGYPPPVGSYPGADYGYGYGYGGYPNAPAAQTNSMAVASLIASLVALPAYILCFVGFIPSILAVILGAVGLSQIKRTGEKGKEMAIAGIAVGAVVAILAFGFLVLISASGSTTF